MLERLGKITRLHTESGTLSILAHRRHIYTQSQADVGAGISQAQTRSVAPSVAGSREFEIQSSSQAEQV